MFEFDKALVTIVEGYKIGLVSDSEIKILKNFLKKAS